MKKSLLATCLFLFSMIALFAQNQRYLDPIFDEVSVSVDEVYGNNVDVLQQAAIDLTMDIYQPVGDSDTSRPAILLSHTGSFIPRIFNQAATGFKDDSVIVEVATRLAKRGYVVFAYTYRQGWLPASLDDNIRKGTLLLAAYRGIQDTRTLARYIRKSIAEEGNPYGVDGDKFIAWGVGTGGYLSFGAATLDEWEEVVLDKFINTSTLLPYVDSLVDGNMDGTLLAPQSLPNHVGYDSKIQMAINMGGALGDISWIDGDAESIEPPMVGFHCPTDIFAPYYVGPVIVPGPNFVVLDQASGTRQAIGATNDFGNNDVLDAGLDTMPSDWDPLADRIDAYAQQDLELPGGTVIKLGTEHMYPFVGLSFGQGHPWDWWDYNVLSARVTFINDLLGTNYSADTIHQSGLLTNPDMSPEKAHRYIDTVMMVALPRMMAGLDLIASVNYISPAEVGLTMAPNPTSDILEIKSLEGYMIRRVQVYDMTGRLVDQIDQIDNPEFRYQVAGRNSGLHLFYMYFDEGVATQQVVIQKN